MGTRDARSSTPSTATRPREAGDFQAYGARRGDRAISDRPRPDRTHRVNQDIAVVLDQLRGSELGLEAARVPVVPDVDLLVGGFPCQDYSVAKTLRQAHGLVGKKGVLWWEIHRLLRLKLEAGRPIRYLFLENVDRLIKSPTGQRGRDFAVMLASLADLGYEVEWRVVNAADYGFPQKRRRVFIIGRLGQSTDSPYDQMLTTGVLARALPLRREGAVRLGADRARPRRQGRQRTFNLGPKQDAVRERRRHAHRRAARGAAVWTRDVEPAYEARG